MKHGSRSQFVCELLAATALRKHVMVMPAAERAAKAMHWEYAMASLAERVREQKTA